MSINGPTEDCWDVFGSDDEEESQKGEEVPALIEQTVLFLAQRLLKQNAQVSLSQRTIGICWGDKSEDAGDWKEALGKRGITQVFPLDLNGSGDKQSVCDALLVLQSASASLFEEQAQAVVRQTLLPGGWILYQLSKDKTLDGFDDSQWNVKEKVAVFEDDSISLRAIPRFRSVSDIKSCPWLPSNHSHEAEKRRLHDITVPLSSFEITFGRLTELSLERSVKALQTYGLCVIKHLVDKEASRQLGKAALEDFHQAASILLKSNNHSVDLYHPLDSAEDPRSYRELSMREDLRLDLRDGPRLRRQRRQSEQNPCSFGGHHVAIREIVLRTMNPSKPELYKGNWGRYNFDGTGPDGSFQPLRVSNVGAIISLPGAADQALHADTPHLFEHENCLPAHYINAFTPGFPTGTDELDPLVGGTAFVCESHQLSKTAHSNKMDFWKALVRPHLEMGDVLLFDCRVLHFGLANNSKRVERPLLYLNMTHTWFHDPKNWDDRQPIFEAGDFEDSE